MVTRSVFIQGDRRKLLLGNCLFLQLWSTLWFHFHWCLDILINCSKRYNSIFNQFQTIDNIVLSSWRNKLLLNNSFLRSSCIDHQRCFTTYQKIVHYVLFVNVYNQELYLFQNLSCIKYSLKFIGSSPGVFDTFQAQD